MVECAAKGVGAVGSSHTERVCDMAETVGACAVLLLALYGGVQAIRGLIARLLKWPRGYACSWVIPLRGHTEQVEYLVRSAHAYRDRNHGVPREIVLLTADTDGETATLAAAAARAVPGVRVCTPAEWVSGL